MDLPGRGADGKGMPHRLFGFFAALTAIALLAVFWRIVEPYDGRIVSQDTQSYLALADNLAAGRGFTEHETDHGPPYQSRRTAWRAPLFPALLAVVFKAVDDPARRVAATTWLQALCGGAAVLLLGIVALQVLGDRWAALLAAAVWARDPLSMDVAKLPLTEPLFLALMMASLALLVFAQRRRAWPADAAAGAVLGLATLARPVLYPFWLMALGAVAYSVRKEGGGRRLAAFVVALLVVVAPWMIRNTLVNGRLTLLTTNTGFNLTLDNSERSHLEVWTELHKRSSSHSVNEADQNAAYLRAAAREIAARPGAFLGRVAERVWRMGTRPALWSLLAWVGLAGLLWRRRKDAFYVVAAAGSLGLVYAIVFYDERMALTLTPFRLLFASMAIMWGGRILAGRLSRLHHRETHRDQFENGDSQEKEEGSHGDQKATDVLR